MISIFLAFVITLIIALMAIFDSGEFSFKKTVIVLLTIFGAMLTYHNSSNLSRNVKLNVEQSKLNTEREDLSALFALYNKYLEDFTEVHKSIHMYKDYLEVNLPKESLATAARIKHEEHFLKRSFRDFQNQYLTNLENYKVKEYQTSNYDSLQPKVNLLLLKHHSIFNSSSCCSIMEMLTEKENDDFYSESTQFKDLDKYHQEVSKMFTKVMRKY